MLGCILSEQGFIRVNLNLVRKAKTEEIVQYVYSLSISTTYEKIKNISATKV